MGQAADLDWLTESGAHLLDELVEDTAVDKGGVHVAVARGVPGSRNNSGNRTSRLLITLDGHCHFLCLLSA